MELPQTDNEQKLIIFVQILGGIHFQQDKQGRKIALIASLNQQVFEAVSCRPVTPGSGTASFDEKLVWQCDRYELKSLKTKNAPIKLDCYEVLPSGDRSLIGSVVIPLRSIPVVTRPRIKSIKPRWHRLIGIENERWRRIKPELNLLVLVTDLQHINQCYFRDGSSTPDLSSDEQQILLRSEPKPKKLPPNVELLEDRGLLQVGCKDTGTDLFVLEIVLKCGQHLDRLCTGTDTFRLQYELFGVHNMSEAKRRKCGSPVYDVKSKITINLRSSVPSLIDYFDNEFKIPVVVLASGEENVPQRAVGKTTIDFIDFLQTKHADEFKENCVTNSYTLETVRRLPVHTIGSTGKELKQIEQIVPSLKVKLSLRCVGSDHPIAQTNIAQPTNEVSVPEQNTSMATTTCAPVTKLESSETHPNHICCKPTTTPSADKSAQCASEKVDIERILMTAEQNLLDIRHTFAFRVCIGTVRFTSGPAPGLWQLALQHPKADTPFTKVRLELLPDIAVHEDRIEFGDVTLELFFSTLPDRVVEVIGSDPSKLTLNGPHSAYAVARLDNESLLVGTRERQPAGVVVMVNEAGENVAIASISCRLEEVGLNYNSQLSGEATDRPNCCHEASRPQTAKKFDETVAYQLVEKQKAWMHEQRQHFLEELEEKERKHLQQLTVNWNERQLAMEKRLADRLAHTDALAAALEEAHRRMETNVPEEDTPRMKQTEQQFKAQLEEIRLKALRLEQESEAQIQTTRRQCMELQEQQAQLHLDHAQLLESNRTLQKELDQERTARAALERQIEELAESKQRYKELWAKLTRKNHQLQEDLNKARTPYYQSSVRDVRKVAKRKTVASNSGSQVSTVPHPSGPQNHGAGDCCHVCACSDGTDDE